MPANSNSPGSADGVSPQKYLSSMPITPGGLALEFGVVSSRKWIVCWSRCELSIVNTGLLVGTAAGVCVVLRTVRPASTRIGFVIADACKVAPNGRISASAAARASSLVVLADSAALCASLCAVKAVDQFVVAVARALKLAVDNP